MPVYPYQLMCENAFDADLVMYDYCPFIISIDFAGENRAGVKLFFP